MECSPPGSSVHEILQARLLEWVAISSSRDLPNPGIESETPTPLALASKFFTTSLLGFPKLIILPSNSKGFPDFLHMAREKNDLCIHMLLLLSHV